MERYFQKVKFADTAKTTLKAEEPKQPRKRFRRKVSGLFAEETDLKRRMSKILEANRNIRSSINAAGLQSRSRGQGASSAEVMVGNQESVPAAETSEKLIELRGDVFKNLPEKRQHFTPTQWHPKVRELLQDPRKENLIKSNIGHLSPTSHRAFVRELHIGHFPKLSQEGYSPSRRIEPPKLPRFETGSVRTLPEFAPKPGMERIATPAVLRKNVRKRYHGYSSSDVLKKRLPKQPSEETRIPKRPRFSEETHSAHTYSQAREDTRSEPWTASRPAQSQQYPAESQPYAKSSIALLVEAAEVATEREHASSNSSSGENSQHLQPSSGTYKRRRLSASEKSLSLHPSGRRNFEDDPEDQNSNLPQPDTRTRTKHNRQKKENSVDEPVQDSESGKEQAFGRPRRRRRKQSHPQRKQRSHRSVRGTTKLPEPSLGDSTEETESEADYETENQQAERHKEHNVGRLSRKGDLPQKRRKTSRIR